MKGNESEQRCEMLRVSREMRLSTHCFPMSRGRGGACAPDEAVVILDNTRATINDSVAYRDPVGMSGIKLSSIRVVAAAVQVELSALV